MAEVLIWVVTKGIESAKRGLSSVADGASREFDSLTSKLSGLAREAATAFSGMGSGLANVASTLSGPLALGALAAGSAIYSFTKRTIDAAQEIDNLARHTQTNAQTLQELIFATERANVRKEALIGVLDRLNVAIAEGQRGTKRYADAWEAFGIDPKKFTDPADALKVLAQRLSETEADSNQMAAAVRLGGDSIRDLMPLLREGADNLANMGQQARDYGRVLNEETIKASKDLDNAWKDLSDTMTKWTRDIAVPIINKLAEISEELRKGKEEAGGFFAAIVKFGTINPFIDLQKNITATQGRIAELKTQIEQATLRDPTLRKAVGLLPLEELQRQLDFEEDRLKLLVRKRAEMLPDVTAPAELKRSGGASKPRVKLPEKEKKEKGKTAEQKKAEKEAHEREQKRLLAEAIAIQSEIDYLERRIELANEAANSAGAAVQQARLDVLAKQQQRLMSGMDEGTSRKLAEDTRDAERRAEESRAAVYKAELDQQKDLAKKREEQAKKEAQLDKERRKELEQQAEWARKRDEDTAEVVYNARLKYDKAMSELDRARVMRETALADEEAQTYRKRWQEEQDNLQRGYQIELDKNKALARMREEQAKREAQLDDKRRKELEQQAEWARKRDEDTAQVVYNAQMAYSQAMSAMEADRLKRESDGRQQETEESIKRWKEEQEVLAAGYQIEMNKNKVLAQLKEERDRKEAQLDDKRQKELDQQAEWARKRDEDTAQVIYNARLAYDQAMAEMERARREREAEEEKRAAEESVKRWKEEQDNLAAGYKITIDQERVLAQLREEKAKKEAQLDEKRQRDLDQQAEWARKRDEETAVVAYNARLAYDQAMAELDRARVTRENALAKRETEESIKRWEEEQDWLQRGYMIKIKYAQAMADAQKERLDKQNKEAADRAKELQSVAEDMGFTFASAFEDAILSGKDFDEVLNSLIEDLGRMILRLVVMKPLAEAVAGVLSNIGGAVFGGGKPAPEPAPADTGGYPSMGHAGGGIIRPGYWGVVGEAGPELIGPAGYPRRVIPNSQLGGGGGVVVQQTFNAGVTREELASVLPMMKAQTMAAVFEAMKRGGRV